MVTKENVLDAAIAVSFLASFAAIVVALRTNSWEWVGASGIIFVGTTITYYATVK